MIRISGLLYGARVAEWFDQISFVDRFNQIQCKVAFQKQNIFYSNKYSSDHFEGEIVKNGVQIGRISGSYLDKIYIDDKCYWDLGLVRSCQTVGEQKNVLKSDCRYREDLIYLIKNDLNNAQNWKTQLEVLQRHDRKLRADY